MKKRKLLLSLFCSLIFIVIIEYQKKTIYLTPEVTGYIYDSVTKKPLSSQIGKIIFEGFSDADVIGIKLNQDGSFNLQPITKSYYFFQPNVRIYDGIRARLYIKFEKFQSNFFDYAPFYWKQVPEEKANFEHHNKINLGIIYLNPEKP
ncbi:hypothetical protein RFI36_12300 [Acinetobacter gerneri]|uniref:Carboxypeptidase regulatory-like domain-containing protein n=1 Tax=Acinetobacter gerneri TaxID=202952 RepID=A0AAW8JIK5_9GAMM|nr:hypothetical protein [Acinetobacter gerneri]MDQ9010371.1 hypothetical protein [Acinetobacter gerneri]MDQ9014570.1 hypothetical protein [Acinetobacter gerneri]MDQ9025741.1 hypothetical protein [Acinetobacter gerneri]MDQ9053022.1 hypothetical protein [Acinetobacter gerneri]MDQ9060640.1 hypothetical protein [Acinetobacter gerneri]